MELRQIRYFVGVSEAGSLLKASAQLYVAQPALGQQMAALERDVGARLFDRSNRGVTLTEAGKVFLEHAKIVLKDVERARMAVRESDAEPRGDVSIGFPTTVALTATMPILIACRAKLPHVRLKIVEAYSGFLREWLCTGRLDLALLYGETPDPSLNKFPLLEDRLVMVSSAKNTSVPRTIPMVSLHRFPLVLPGRDHGLRRLIDEASLTSAIELNIVAEIESLGSVKRAVEAGIGSTILPLAAVTQELANGTLRTSALTAPRMTRRMVFATNIARPATIASAAVTTLVIGVIKDMVTTGAWPARWLGDV